MNYTYLIGWSQHGMYYYGVRYASNCEPSALWVTYFTSSKHVHAFAKEHGAPDIIECRRTFNTAAEARLWEHKVLRRLRAHTRGDWLNRTTNRSIYNPPEVVEQIAERKRGKTYEDIYGEEKAAQLRASRSHSNKERGARSQATKDAISRTRKMAAQEGRLNFTPPPRPTRETVEKATRTRVQRGIWNKGVPRTNEVKDKIRQAAAARPIETCVYCGFESRSRGNMVRYHGDRCKQRDQLADSSS